MGKKKHAAAEAIVEELAEREAALDGDAAPKKKVNHRKDKRTCHCESWIVTSNSVSLASDCVGWYAAWDNDSIDHWKIEPFKEGDMKSPLLEESSFATLFTKYRDLSIYLSISLSIYLSIYLSRSIYRTRDLSIG